MVLLQVLSLRRSYGIPFGGKLRSFCGERPVCRSLFRYGRVLIWLPEISGQLFSLAPGKKLEYTVCIMDGVYPEVKLCPV